MDLIKTIEESQKRDVASFKVGDTVKVHFKIIEGKTERVQVQDVPLPCAKTHTASAWNGYSLCIRPALPKLK